MADLVTVVLTLWLSYEAVSIVKEVRQSQNGRDAFINSERLSQGGSTPYCGLDPLHPDYDLHKKRIQEDSRGTGKTETRVPPCENHTGHCMQNSHEKISR